MARLLLLEDDQSLIDGLVYALTKEGFALDVAMTVREVRAQLATQAYDLLLLDQTLPDGSGLALCEEVRAGGNAVPIIFLTAMDEEIQATIISRSRSSSASCARAFARSSDAVACCTSRSRNQARKERCASRAGVLIARRSRWS